MVYRLDEFKENSVNPITGKAYDDSWIVLILTNSDDYQYMCGSFNGCAYTLKISRSYRNWELSVCDFLTFYEHKNIIAVISESDLRYAKTRYGSHSFRDNFLRENEPEVLVHSTTLENWESIQKDSALKCFNSLKKGETPIGRLLGDPKDFSDYVMFSGGGTAGEIVVSSKQAGKIVMDENARYKTGARLYFDAKKTAADGLLLRDGAHLKVKDFLPLKPYLIWTATWKNSGLSERISTPKTFTEKANKKFYEITGIRYMNILK